MQTTFNDLVSSIRSMTLSEKLEIKNIVEKEIIDEQRNKIHEYYLESKEEFMNNDLQFSSDINQLKNMLKK